MRKRVIQLRIIRPSVEIITPINREHILEHIEKCGRICYKSEDKITPESAGKFIKGIVKSGHESVIEHYSVTVKFICDRACSHQVVRSRLASYSQVSQRYCNYSDGKFNKEITFIAPPWYGDEMLGEFNIENDEWWVSIDDKDRDEKFHSAQNQWFWSLATAEQSYFNMIEYGHKPEQARTVLPNATMTELMMTANMREWRHFLRLRTSKAADPQIRAVAIPLLHMFKEQLPELFFDIEEE